MWLLSADVGGTFTDLVLIDPDKGALIIDKVSSAERGSAAPIMQGISRILAKAGAGKEDIALFVHGFTVATNAFLMRTGSRVALIVTEGFRDLLDIGDQLRPSLYSLTQSKPEAVVPRARVLEVPERLDSRGAVVQALEPEAAERVAAATAALRPEAVAICLNFAHLNDAHERLLREAVVRHLPGVPIYLSSEVNPQIEEYPRANTTAVAAYVGPIVDRYVTHLEGDLADNAVAAPLLLMRSDGGVATARAARRNPAHMLLSGPAGGVIAGQHLGRLLGVGNLITFDMGGTSADFSAIVEGEARKVRGRRIDGQPLRLPTLDIETISAGGGSVGWIDRGGALRVGPWSAGAVPGPACYGKGGTEPTITDAAVVLGLLDPADYLGGEMPLDAELARRSVEEKVAAKLGLSLEEAAFGIVSVANAMMTQAIRSLSVERGLDVRRFSLLAFGGAGPLYAPYLADSLNMAEVIAPPHPGVFAAHGLLLGNIRHTAMASFARPLDGLDPVELERQVRGLFEGLSVELDADGVPPRGRRFLCSGDLRYRGQFHEIEIPLPSPGEGWSHEAVKAAFIAMHEQLYGHADAEAPIEIVNLRAEAIGQVATAATAPRNAPAPFDAEPQGSRPVYLDRRAGWRDCALYRRESLRPGAEIAGPAIISQVDSTVLVPLDHRARVDFDGSLRIQRSKGV